MEPRLRKNTTRIASPIAASAAATVRTNTMYHAIVFFPLIGALIAGLFGRFIGARMSELVTTGCLAFASEPLGDGHGLGAAVAGHEEEGAPGQQSCEGEAARRHELAHPRADEPAEQAGDQIGLAILVVFFRNRGSIAVEDVSMMKG
jgi:hypothetical protein